MKFCVRTFDTYQGGNKNIHYTILGSADGAENLYDLQVRFRNLGDETVLIPKECKLILPAEAKAYSIERGFNPELGMIFMFDDQSHLCVRGQDAWQMWLLNLGSGELTQRPSSEIFVTVREWKLERQLGPKSDSLLVFQPEAP